MSKVPFIAVSADELGLELRAGDSVHCRLCEGFHEVKNAKDQSGADTNLLMFYECGGDSYLAGVGGRALLGAAAMSSPKARKLAVPNCERCGAPAFNVNVRGEHTGVHSSLEQCLREATTRIASLERHIDILMRERE